MSDQQKTRVLWLTNLPAPYRFPIWNRMATQVELKVIFLLKRSNWRNWPEPTNKVWKHDYLSFNSWRISEYDIIPSFSGAKKILKEIDVAIIGGWESPIFIRTILLARKKRIKVIQFYESTSDSHRFKRGPIAQFRKWILNKSHSVVTISESSKENLINMGIASDKILSMFNPVDVNWFYSYAKHHRKNPKMGHHFIYAGQLIPRKNVDIIVRSFAAIRAQHDTLTIVGDGPLAQNLKKLAESLGVAESVIFSGHRSREEIASLYSVSNTLVLASTNEVWGLVVNEALASGLHVVVSEKCGVAQFVQKMRGTYISGTDLQSVQDSMVQSANDWSGYIYEPEILKFTPELFAEGILRIANASSF